jgi:hypothetical protein
MQISDSTIRFLDRMATGNWQVSVVDWGFEMRMSATEPWIVPGSIVACRWIVVGWQDFAFFHQGKKVQSTIGPFYRSKPRIRNLIAE